MRALSDLSEYWLFLWRKDRRNFGCLFSVGFSVNNNKNKINRAVKDFAEMSSPAPKSPEQTDKSKKYDRQLR